EPAPLVAERRAWQLAEPARDEAHTDAGGVKVRRGDHSIRAHRHLPAVGAMRLRRADGVKRLLPSLSGVRTCLVLLLQSDSRSGGPDPTLTRVGSPECLSGGSAWLPGV